MDAQITLLEQLELFQKQVNADIEWLNKIIEANDTNKKTT